MFSCNARFLHTRMKNCISHHDESMLHARVSLQDLNPEKVLSSRLRLSSRNSFKIVTRIVHTKSWCYLICPMAEYTPDNVADKHWPIELALLSVVISFHNFSLIGWKIGMVATKSREQWIHLMWNANNFKCGKFCLFFIDIWTFYLRKFDFCTRKVYIRLRKIVKDVVKEDDAVTFFGCNLWFCLFM